MKYKKVLAALLCGMLTITSVSTSAYATSQMTTQQAVELSLDMEDFTLNEESGIYDLNTKIHNLKGTVTTTETIKSLRYELKDEAGTIIKAGYATVKKNGSFKISKMGFLLGQNTLTFIVKTADSQYETTYQIYNEEIKNTDNVKVDEKDNDGDGLINYWEDYFGTKKNKADSDGDGLSDYDEIKVLGSDPLQKDSDENGISDYEEDFDGDGINNGQELLEGTSPVMADSDEDGLTDSEEKNLGTDPMAADSDGDGAPDGWEVEHGHDPIMAEASFDVTLTAEDGNGILTVTGSGAAAAGASIAVEENAFLLENDRVLSLVYQVTLADGYTNAQLSINSSDENAVVYQYDATTQQLTEVSTTWLDNRSTVILSASGSYVLMTKAEEVVPDDGKEETDTTTDSNQDGLTDAVTKALCEGTLLTGNGEKVFGEASFEEVQANEDFDQDGLKNGQEISILTGEDGVEYAYLTSSPVNADSDADGITDAKDTAPWERGLEDGVIGAIQIYSRHADTESFVAGHAWLVFTSYVDNQDFVLDEVRMSYQYDDNLATYVDRGTNGTYTLDRGDYVSIGNYRTATLDVLYDSVGSDFPTLVKDLGIENQFDLDNLNPLEILKYAVTEEGRASINQALYGGSDKSIRYNEEIYDTYAYDPNYEVPNAVLTKEVTQEQLEAIMEYDNNHNYYNLISNNCSSIATAAWNLAFNDTLSPEGEGFYALVDTPMVLKAHILEREGAVQDVLEWGITVE